MDDIFADKASSAKSEQKEKEREVRRGIREEKQYKKTLEDCQWCFDGSKLEKNIVIAMGEKARSLLSTCYFLIKSYLLVLVNNLQVNYILTELYMCSSISITHGRTLSYCSHVSRLIVNRVG